MLPLESSVNVPVYLTQEQHWGLQRFIDEPPSMRPHALMAVGSIKSGKSTVLNEVLPGMLAAQYQKSWPATRRRPVVFNYDFPLGADAEAAAMAFQDALASFARDIGVRFEQEATAGAALNILPLNLREFAERIKAAGGELWLLLDDMQGPIHGSTPTGARRFTHTFKRVVEYLSPHGRLVVTGTGLVALLNSFRTAYVNSFVLWQSIAFVSLGREPAVAPAQGMAEALLPPYAAHWTADAKATITPDAVLRALAPEAHGGLTSRRPALIAYMLGRMGDAQSDTPEQVLHAAVGDALYKLKSEAMHDLLCALPSLDSLQRRILRAVAAGGYTYATLEGIRAWKDGHRFREGRPAMLPEQFAGLIGCLREEGAPDDVVRLQPPYSTLLLSWIRTDGGLAVQLDNGRVDLDDATRKNLAFLGQTAQRRAVQAAGLQGAVSIAVLDSIARHGIGVRDGSTGLVRPLTSAAEFDAVPAFRHFKQMLSAKYLAGIDDGEPSLSNVLGRAAAAADSSAPAAEARFQERIGWDLLLAFGHFEAHIWAYTEQLGDHGLTAAAVADGVHAAACVLVDHGCFGIMDGRLGRP